MGEFDFLPSIQVQTFLIHTRQQDSPHGVTVDTMDLNDSGAQPMADKNSLMSTHDIFSNMAKGSLGNEGGELFETWLVLEYCDRGSLAKVSDGHIDIFVVAALGTMQESSILAIDCCASLIHDIS